MLGAYALNRTTFFSKVSQSDYDFICITETWLTCDFYDREYFDDSFSVFRSDRSIELSGATRGGGVAVAARAALNPLRRDWPVPTRSHSDCVWVSIPLNYARDITSCCTGTNGNCTSYLNIGCIYIPHGAGYRETLAAFLDIASELITDRPNDLFLITGDFNISLADWTATPFLEMHLVPSGNYASQLLNEFLSFTFLKQYNGIYNSNNRILDLVLCNQECSVSACGYPLTQEDVHHRSLLLELRLKFTPLLQPAQRCVYKFHSANYSEINNKLSGIDWSEFFSNLNFNQCITKFYEKINNLIKEFVPQRRLRLSTKIPIWYTRPLTKVLKEKRKYHKLWKLYGNPLDYESFKILRKRAERMESECYKQFINLSESNINSNPKYLWTYVKSLRSHRGLPQTMNHRDTIVTDGELICNIFNDYFHSVFEPQQNIFGLDMTHSSNDLIDINSIEVTIDLVYKHLRSINVNKGAGPDGVHPLFIKNCSKTLTTPITFLFTSSLREGCVPEVWKEAWITPIPKGIDRNCFENYRPISKLCCFGKILEKIVTNQLFDVLRNHIIPNQHGFIRGRSVDTNLLTFTDEILEALDKGYQVDAVYTDFAKAFDKICHNTLLMKLWRLGIHGDLFRWIKSYSM